MESDLAFIWAGIIAFAVFAYVVLDGFDLGVGILFPAYPKKEDRDLMMNTIAPIWDGNETWLVLGGGGLFAVFPLAYAVVMPALYAPIIAMLLFLVFRGVAFEFVHRTKRWRKVWEWAFSGGSIGAALAQGVALGALVQGIAVENRAYAGGDWDWLSLFSILTGVALLVGYILLGSTWLVMKTEGEMRARAKDFALKSLVGTLGLIGIASLWTPFLSSTYYDHWFKFPNILFSIMVPGLVAACAYLAYDGLRKDEDSKPFLASLGLFALCFMGIGISFYPYMVPPSLTIADAAAPDDSLGFLLVGAAVLVPIILAYTAYAYWVFRGKVRPEDGYH